MSTRTKKPRNVSNVDIHLDLEISDRMLDRLLSGNHQPHFYTDNLGYLMAELKAEYDEIIKIHDFPKAKFPTILRGNDDSMEFTPAIVSDMIGLVLKPSPARVLLKYNYDAETKKYKNKAYIVRNSEWNRKFFLPIAMEKDVGLGEIDMDVKFFEEPDIRTREEVEELFLTVTKAKQMFANNKFSKNSVVPIENLNEKISAYQYTESIELVLSYMKGAFEARYPKKGSSIEIEGTGAMRILRGNFQ